MAHFSSVLFQLDGVRTGRLGRLDHDLMIVESGQHSTASTPRLTSDTLAELAAEDKTVIGYLNIAVTDHYRDYWQADWTVNGPADNPDMGDINPEADVPDWLLNAHGAAANFGPIVDYADPEWLEAVLLPYAADLITAGYGGLFLDDVAQYYTAARNANGDYPEWQAARDMMQLVVTLADRLESDYNIDAEALTLVLNGGAYIVNDYLYGLPEDAGPVDYDLINRYRSLVDGLVIENVTEGEFDAWTAADAWFNGTAGGTLAPDTTQLIAIETAGRITDIELILDRLNSINAELFVASNANYDDAMAPEIIGSSGNDSLRGNRLDQVLIGLDGNDTLVGRGGADIIYGGDGNDVIYGSAGDDIIFAGNGHDTIYGGGGNDIIIGGRGRDVIYGGSGDDSISGGRGRDVIRPGRGEDEVHRGDIPDDLLLDDWLL